MILEVTCDDIALRSFLNIVKNFLTLIQIIGPILCMISLILIFVNLSANPDDKKMKAKIKNVVIALILLFMVPVIVDATMLILDDSFKVSSCWQASEDSTDDDAQYIGDDSKDKSSVITDPGEYDQGTARDEESDE